MEKVVLGLSGGVDSAVSAYLLSERYEVHCLYLDIGLGGSGAEDAAKVANDLQLSFAIADIRQELEQQVCKPFTEDYLSGRTPLPCARCNPTVKFPALTARADHIGAAYIATGHYARVNNNLLMRGASSNDQSYMLAQLPQETIQRVIFPLGDYKKDRVRALAREKNISVAHKPDSMEICFIPDGEYAAWLGRRGVVPPEGNFVDNSGAVLGRHQGIHCYTLGQRRGLGVSGPCRYFVAGIRPETNEVVLSDGSDLLADHARCTGLNWIDCNGLDGLREVTVRLRHSRDETPAVILPDGEDVMIQMKRPARAPTPGQLAVFYDGEIVVGSGWIL